MTWTFEALVTAFGLSAELSLLTKASVITLLGLAGASLARRARASVRHAILASTFAALVLLPAATYVMPTIAIAVQQPTAVRTANPSPQSSAPSVSRDPSKSGPANAAGAERGFASRAVSRATVVASVWLLGAGSLGIWFIGALWRLGRLRRSGLPWLPGRSVIAPLATDAGIGRRVDVLLHEEIAAPVTCGFLKPAILLPADVPSWDDAALRRALVHELAHVRRRDWWMHVAARAVCIAYWFHPLVWIAYRQLCLAAEHACDDVVVEREESTVYAEQLVSLARKIGARKAQPALAMAGRSDLSARVSALLDSQRARGRTGMVRATLIATAAAGVVLTVAPMRVVAVSVPAPVATERSQPRQPGLTRLDRALVEAADEGDAQDVAELLDGGANVNAAVDGDGTALIIAAREGHLALVTMLLDRGADPNLPVPGDGNPLIMAAREGYLPIVQLLLDRGADVNDVVDGDENALIQASGEGNLDVVKLLVARGADVNARVFAERAFERPNGEWRTPLNMALRNGHRVVAAFLTGAGARQ